MNGRRKSYRMLAGLVLLVMGVGLVLWRTGVGGLLLEEWKTYAEPIRNIIWGAILIIGVPFLALRTISADKQADAANRQAKIAEDRYIAESFTKGLELIGGENPALVLGGVYTLQQLSEQNSDYYWQIMEVYTNFVHLTAPWPSDMNCKPHLGDSEGQILESDDSLDGKFKKVRELRSQYPKPRLEIEGILRIIGQRSEDQIAWECQHHRRLNFSWTDLQRMRLERNFERVDFSYSNLSAADLRNASLIAAKFQYAILRHCAVKGADFTNADLGGADLTGTDMTVEQLNVSTIDENTVLPSHLVDAPGNDETASRES